MIIDITGTMLIPGEQGKNCPGNGQISSVECCCDECDYLQCCLPEHPMQECLNCNDPHCPHAKKQNTN